MPGVATQTRTYVHDTDPREVTLARVESNLDGCAIGGADILIAVYEHPDQIVVGMGGKVLHVPKSNEDKFQGKVGLILQMGPLCYSERRRTNGWFPVDPKVGDWVIFDINMSWQFAAAKAMCRLVEDTNIRAVIPHPDAVI